MILPAAILFDMDGTLTKERIDFAGLRRDLGMEPDEAILEAVHRMSPADRHRAEQILHDYEHRAACESTLNPGCADLLHWLDARGIGRALITRNTRKSVQTVFDTHDLHFEIKITREDGKFKPSPEPLWLACERLGVRPDKAWMVGDWKYDIEAATAARIFSVWISYGRERVFDAVPSLDVPDLNGLFELLKQLDAQRE
ncbi:MAG: HAD family hydrolase [Burkholderiales bacterium]|nr:HAD family hydrolase [Phycisphaerae bacterium]